MQPGLSRKDHNFWTAVGGCLGLICWALIIAGLVYRAVA